MPDESPDQPTESNQPQPSDQEHMAKENAFLRQAIKEGVVAPNAALAMADFTELELDSSGALKGLDELFARLRKEEPALFANSQTPGLDQQPSTHVSQADRLKDAARASGLTRDIHAYRQSRR